MSYDEGCLDLRAHAASAQAGSPTGSSVAADPRRRTAATTDAATATAPAPQTVAFAVRGPITRADLPGLCDHACALLERSRAGVAFCDVHGVDPDAVTVDALARLQLAARRHGCQVRLRNASSELVELVRDVLPDLSRTT